MSLWRIRVVNHALGVPRPSGVRSAVLAAARQPVCDACDCHAISDGAHRCMHIDRKCELLHLHRASETCPKGLWPDTEVQNG